MDAWFHGQIIYTWVITRGHPISGNLHINVGLKHRWTFDNVWDLPSSWLTFSHGRLPIYRWFYIAIAIASYRWFFLLHIDRWCFADWPVQSGDSAYIRYTTRGQLIVQSGNLYVFILFCGSVGWIPQKLNNEMVVKHQTVVKKYHPSCLNHHCGLVQ